ncbi:DUF2339 domain-containing protein [Duganella sp. LX20W]|uniref:DUF2339 domain-containing protein n=2 Tax=Rugamonas brunnea TaxID=2758569 RepID=A0A7W2IBE7_9BURK|nr:DUF2339 domain-containing protein [Rugamonas brunnea]
MPVERARAQSTESTTNGPVAAPELAKPAAAPASPGPSPETTEVRPRVSAQIESPATATLTAPASASEMVPSQTPAPPVPTPLNEPTAPPAYGSPASSASVPATPEEPVETVEVAPEWLQRVKAWLFGGNLVAKLGLLILFIGVSFLLKYAAERVTIPIELRLAGIVLADLIMLAWAWRIRTERPTISLPAQGTTLAILMLVIFGANRLYHLLPTVATFALLLILTVFTCMLAVLQNSQWLAIFGIVGGFAAPILASSGGGSQIGLFSYYALLDAGVFALALLRSWRQLNVLGFCFTFSISTAWGVLRYQPEHYLSVQLFLILFFAFYLAIPLAYAHQRTIKLKHYVDGTLVFGTPLVAFGLQVNLVHDMAFGVAYSALALALLYCGLAMALARRRERFGLLTDSFLALGVVFGTLAVPLALDGRWTSTTWALEGAALVWVGIRQRQTLTWSFGLLMQACAWIAFLSSLSRLTGPEALRAHLWLGFALLATTAFLIAILSRARQDKDDRENGFDMLASVFLTVSVLGLMAGVWTEIFLRTAATTQANLLVISAMAVATLLLLCARHMAWPLANSLALLAYAAGGVMLLQTVIQQWQSLSVSPDLLAQPVLGELLILTGAMFSYRILSRSDNAEARGMNTILLLWSMAWWFGIILPALSGWLTARYQLLRYGQYGADRELWWAAYQALLAASTPAVVLLARRFHWTGLHWSTVANWLALAGTTLYLLGVLYLDNRLPPAEVWFAYALSLLAGEWLMRAFFDLENTIARQLIKAVNLLRAAGPWLMIWPVAATWIARWLQDGNNVEAQLLADAGWQTSPSWARYIPAWLMMATLGWLITRCRTGSWPVRPYQQVYRELLIPLGCAWSVTLIVVWNLTQDGTMAPLPYIPLLNPLDLTSCFAILLSIHSYRFSKKQAAAENPANAQTSAKMRMALYLGGYAWFNLVLLRSASHYSRIPYTWNALFNSNFVQAMLALVWSVTALILMRHAAKHQRRHLWTGGALLLAVVLGKLFLIDLSNVGSIDRIVSFVGVGALMVGVGYLAPYPSERANRAEVPST